MGFKRELWWTETQKLGINGDFQKEEDRCVSNTFKMGGENRDVLVLTQFVTQLNAQFICCIIHAVYLQRGRFPVFHFDCRPWNISLGVTSGSHMTFPVTLYEVLTIHASIKTVSRMKMNGPTSSTWHQIGPRMTMEKQHSMKQWHTTMKSSLRSAQNMVGLWCFKVRWGNHENCRLQIWSSVVWDLTFD